MTALDAVAADPIVSALMKLENELLVLAGEVSRLKSERAGALMAAYPKCGCDHHAP